MADGQRPRHLVTAVAIIVRPDGSCLLGKRKHASGRGCFAGPGGSVEVDELPVVAAVRETFEETGIVLNPKAGTLIDADIGRNDVMGSWIVLFFMFHAPAGVEAANKEPESTEDWDWFSLIDPPKPLIPGFERLLAKYGQFLYDQGRRRK